MSARALRGCCRRSTEEAPLAATRQAASRWPAANGTLLQRSSGANSSRRSVIVAVVESQRSRVAADTLSLLKILLRRKLVFVNFRTLSHLFSRRSTLYREGSMEDPRLKDSRWARTSLTTIRPREHLLTTTSLNRKSRRSPFPGSLRGR